MSDARRRRFEDAVLLALMVEEGPSARKYRWPLKGGKGKERKASLVSREEIEPY